MLAGCERIVNPIQGANRVIIELVEEGHGFVEHNLWMAAQLYGTRARGQKPEGNPCGSF